jgi:hypothetical protein
MNLFALFIILLSTIENIWPIFMGYALTPKNYMFLGTIHHPGDYFYYLSQFTQGTTRLLLTKDLYTSEPLPANLVGWFNALLGLLFSRIGISSMIGYDVSVIVLTVVLLTASYFLALFIFRSRFAATLTLYLFTLFHAFPLVVNGKLAYHDYWSNVASPLARFGHVPHQLLIIICSIVSVHLINQWGAASVRTKRTLGIALFCLHIVIASLQPVLWVLLTAVAGISMTLDSIIKRRPFKASLPHFIPVLLMGLGGFAPALYLSRLFMTAPYSQLKAWELAQHNPLTPTHFLLSTGPVFLIALVALPAFLFTFKRNPDTGYMQVTFRNLPFARIHTVLFAGISLFLFLSPIPYRIGLPDIRFVSSLTVLCVSIIAANGLLHIKKLYLWLVLIALTLILIPSHIRSAEIANDFQQNNAYQYLSVWDYSFLVSSAKVSSNEDDAYLVIWPFNLIFPGVTAKKSFGGHPLLTIDSQTKDSLAQQFFDNVMSTDEKKQFLRKYHITYVIAYVWTPALSQAPFLSTLLKTSTLVLYKVNE